MPNIGSGIDIVRVQPAVRIQPNRSASTPPNPLPKAPARTMSAGDTGDDVHGKLNASPSDVAACPEAAARAPREPAVTPKTCPAGAHPSRVRRIRSRPAKSPGTARRLPARRRCSRAPQIRASTEARRFRLRGGTSRCRRPRRIPPGSGGNPGPASPPRSAHIQLPPPAGTIAGGLLPVPATAASRTPGARMPQPGRRRRPRRHGGMRTTRTGVPRTLHRQRRAHCRKERES